MASVDAVEIIKETDLEKPNVFCLPWSPFGLALEVWFIRTCTKKETQNRDKKKGQKGPKKFKPGWNNLNLLAKPGAKINTSLLTKNYIHLHSICHSKCRSKQIKQQCKQTNKQTNGTSLQGPPQFQVLGQMLLWQTTCPVAVTPALTQLNPPASAFDAHAWSAQSKG